MIQETNTTTETTSTPYPVTPVMTELILIKGEKTWTTSLKVAEVCEKEHKNVLRDIENLGCPEEFWRLNFEPRDYIDERGKTYPMIEMTRDGMALLVMGYQGPKAMKFKVAYIAAFNYMEGLLRHDAIQAGQILATVNERLDRMELAVAQRTRIQADLESSPVGLFVQECCTVRPKTMIIKKELYQAYEAHSLKHGINPLIRSWFFYNLYKDIVGTKSARRFIGLTRIPCVSGIQLNREGGRS